MRQRKGPEEGKGEREEGRTVDGKMNRRRKGRRQEQDERNVKNIERWSTREANEKRKGGRERKGASKDEERSKERKGKEKN